MLTHGLCTVMLILVGIRLLLVDKWPFLGLADNHEYQSQFNGHHINHKYFHGVSLMIFSKIHIDYQHLLKLATYTEYKRDMFSTYMNLGF